METMTVEKETSILHPPTSFEYRVIRFPRVPRDSPAGFCFCDLPTLSPKHPYCTSTERQSTEPKKDIMYCSFVQIQIQILS